MAVLKRHDDDDLLMCSADTIEIQYLTDFTVKSYTPDSILWYMSPWAAQMLL